MRVAVIGGGISGLATGWYAARAGHDVHVLEAGDAPGGTMTSLREGGFVFDAGPNGFLVTKPSTWRLCHDLGMGDKLVPASSAAKRRYLLLDDGLHAIPHGPAELVKTSLLSGRGKLRAAREPFTRRAPPRDESVHAFFAARFGKEVADRFAAPMVLGITTGDARDTSIQVLFPQLQEAERLGGSVVKGMGALAKRRRADAAARGERAPEGGLTSVEGGMGALAEELAHQLGERLHTGAEVRKLERVGDGWRVHAGERVVEADRVVLCLPAPVTSRLLADVAPTAAERAADVRYAGARVVMLGFRREDVGRALDGFGFLVPRGGRARILGCVWTSTVFPGRAPEGHVTFRVIAGGTPDPGFVSLSDDEALAAALKDLRRPLQLRADPVFVRHVRWERAIPQAPVGHLQKMAALDDALAREAPGVIVSGNAYRGVSVNDCVARAQAVAAELAG